MEPCLQQQCNLQQAAIDTHEDELALDSSVALDLSMTALNKEMQNKNASNDANSSSSTLLSSANNAATNSNNAANSNAAKNNHNNCSLKQVKLLKKTISQLQNWFWIYLFPLRTEKWHQ